MKNLVVLLAVSASLIVSLVWFVSVDATSDASELIVIAAPDPATTSSRTEPTAATTQEEKSSRRQAEVVKTKLENTSPRSGIPHIVAAKFLDESKQPIEGVELRYGFGDKLDLARSGSDGNVELAIYLVKPASAYRVMKVEARHPKFATRTLEVSPRPDMPTWVGDVQLITGASIAGRVEGADGPVSLFVYKHHNLRELRRREPTLRWAYPSEPDGSYRIDGLLEGPHRIIAVSEDGYAGVSSGVTTLIGELIEVPTIQLAGREPEDFIEGRVIAASGESLEGVRLEKIGINERGTTSGKRWREIDVEPDGSFRVELYEREDAQLVAMIPGVTGGVWARRVAAGARGVELQLPPARDVIIEVTNKETGEPLTNTRLKVKLYDDTTPVEPGERQAYWTASKEYGELWTDDAGRVEIAEPGQTYRVSIWGGTWSGNSLKQTPGQSEGGEEEAADSKILSILAWMGDSNRVKLAQKEAKSAEEADSIAGRVLMNGQPMEGVRVTAHNASAPGTHKLTPVKSSPRWRENNPYYQQSTAEGKTAQSNFHGFAVTARGSEAVSATSNAEGAFVLTEELDTLHEWVIFRAEAPGFASRIVGPLRLRDLIGYDRLERDGVRRENISLISGKRLPVPELTRTEANEVSIELHPTGTLEGQLWLPPGTEPTGRVIGVSRGDGLARTTTVQPDGTYRFVRLPAGDWQVREVPRWMSRQFNLIVDRQTPELASSIEWDCFVAPGKVTSFDVDLSVSACEVWGVVRIPGIEVDGMSVSVSFDNGQAGSYSLNSSKVKVVGDSFHLELSHAGRMWITLRSNHFASYSPFTLEPGSNSIEINIPTAELNWEEKPNTLNASTEDAPEWFSVEPYLLASWVTDDGQRGESQTLVADENGARFGPVPVGQVKVMRAIPEFTGFGCGGIAPDRTEFGPPEIAGPAYTEYVDRNGDHSRHPNFGGRTVLLDFTLKAGEAQTVREE